MLRSFAAAALALVATACASPPPAVSAWNADALQQAVDYAASQKSTGFLIIEDGQIIADHIWPLPADAEQFRSSFVHGQAPDGALLEDVASQQKSFVSILVGVAIDKGMLDIEKPVSHYVGAGWSKATPEQEAAIKVRNLLEMNSGLKENLTFDAPAGTRFFYNTPAYAVVKRVLESAAKQPLDTLTHLWLTQPLGMKDTAWRKRPNALADSGNPTGLVTTPHDIARMGRLVLDGGAAPDGKRVISKQQFDAMFMRTSTNPSYGRLWWLNGADYTVASGAGAPRREGQFIASGPRDMVAAMGAQDRKLYVVPSLKLIVVRTGQAAPDRDFDDKLWKLLTAAMPQH
jgi:CubicO group peptidase (beta-lactamase class C family)